MDFVNPVVPVLNRPGVFAVLSREAATAIQDGYMKLYWSEKRGLEVELISRTRKPISVYDPGARMVFFAVGPDGALVGETAS